MRRGKGGEERDNTIFVARIEEEQQLVQADRRLIELFEAKIRDGIKEVWGEWNRAKRGDCRDSQTELVVPQRPHPISITRAEPADAEPEN